MTGRVYNAGVVAAWAAAMVAIAYAGNTSGLVRFGYVLAASVIAGFLCGRWWVLWAPVAGGALLIALSVADPGDIDLSAGWIALLYAVAAAVASACMALGVALRRVTGRGRTADEAVAPTSAPNTPDTPRSPSPP